MPLEPLQVDVPKRRHVEEGCGRFALCPALVVGRVDQSAASGRIENDHVHAGREGHRLRRERATVDQHGMARPACSGDQLVHDAAIHPDPLVLGPLPQSGHAGRVPVEPTDRSKRPSSGDFQGGARREAGPYGHVALDDPFPAAQFMAGVLEAPGHGLEVLDPAVSLVVELAGLAGQLV